MENVKNNEDLSPEPPVSPQLRGTRHEEEEDAGGAGPPLLRPLPRHAGHGPQQVRHCGLDLVAEVVQALEQVHVGDVEGVSGRAADQEVAQVEQSQEPPGVLVPPPRPEGEDALGLEHLLGLATLLRQGEGVHPAPHVEEDHISVWAEVALDHRLRVIMVVVNVSVVENALANHLIYETSLIGL